MLDSRLEKRTGERTAGLSQSRCIVRQSLQMSVSLQKDEALVRDLDVAERKTEENLHRELVSA